MPQLDTVYILMTFLWTWLTMFMMMKKTSTCSMTHPQKCQNNKSAQPTLPWL